MTDVFVINRRKLLGLGLALGVGGVLGSGPAEAAAEKTILFVCQAGTVKSAIARELFRARASVRGIAINAISRGLKPEDHVSPALKAHLTADGIDTLRDPLRALDQATLDRADVVVLFDPLPPSLSRPDARDWTATPSMNDDYARSRAFMDAHIEALLTEIAGKSGA